MYVHPPVLSHNALIITLYIGAPIPSTHFTLVLVLDLISLVRVVDTLRNRGIIARI